MSDFVNISGWGVSTKIPMLWIVLLHPLTVEHLKYRNNGKMLHNIGCYGNNQKYIQDNIIICV